ncbi:MAG TPA: class I SAM-dependent methyltransferase [Chloroflexota bacterium]|nr:class I SAM-dependent methyltransferase [Chloroflexota bacterium]
MSTTDSCFTDPAHLRSQYADAEKLRSRQESHRRFSERPSQAWKAWLLDHLRAGPGEVILDAGCGPGTYHRALAPTGARILACDLSAGMLAAALRQAAQFGLPVVAVQADAQSLPLLDASCTRVLAAHMLYHVPDRVRALREMRRVLKPGGRVVLATNAADSTARLVAIHLAAAAELGYAVPEGGMPFTLDDLPLVRSVFPTAVRQVFHNAFVFPTAEAVLRYYASGMVDFVLPVQPGQDGDGERAGQASGDDGGDAHRRRLLPLVERRVREIIAREGVFRDPKDAGCFVADLP